MHKFSAVPLHNPGELFDGLGYPTRVEMDPKDISLLANVPLLMPEPAASLLAPDAPPYTMDGSWDTPVLFEPGPPSYVMVRGTDAPKEFAAFENLDVFISMEAHFTNGVPWTETPMFDRVAKNIADGNIKWGCRTAEEYATRLQTKVDPLFEAIQRDGYQTQDQLGTGRPSDEIRIAINRSGHPMFVDGRHRLAIAKLLGLDSVPVRIIVRHTEWTSFQDRVWDYAKSSRGRVYQQIEHPDLEFFPAHHDDDRFDLLAGSLGDYTSENKTLIDIGTHWGHMCHKFEELGFTCTATELLKSNAEFLTGIRNASQRHFDVWHGNIFDFEHIEGMDVILALNILHHFCKTESDHEALILLLHRMRGAELMFFQPHRHDPPGQMADAFINYSESEFVDFVCATPVSTDTIGSASPATDGRSTNCGARRRPYFHTLTVRSLAAIGRRPLTTRSRRLPC